jgi:hypothetical protein
MQVTLRDGTTLSCDDEPFAGGVDGASHWSADRLSVIKFYHQPEPWRAPGLEAILTRFNAVRDDPYWQELLCWPTGIVQSPRLGVVIPKAQDGLKKIACFVQPKWLHYHPEDNGTYQARVRAVTRLARAMWRLHAKGLCHSDISDNNVFANPHDGRVYVIDCDGLVVPDLPYARAVVVGSDGYMAPELVAERAHTPSVESDRHSLAVLIYQFLLFHHPLLGRKVHDPNDSDANETLALGERALYVEHPTDRSNCPAALPYPARLLGHGVNRLLQKAFVDGLHQPSRRPLPSEWERELVRLGDTIISCLNPACSMKSFPLPEVIPFGGLRCPWCGTVMGGIRLPVLRWCSPEPGQIGVYRPDGSRKVAWPGATVHEWHIRPNTLPGPNVDSRTLANFQMTLDTTGANRWLLVNQGLPFLEVADPGDGWKRVRNNEAVELRPQRQLRFGPPTANYRVAVVDVVQM